MIMKNSFGSEYISILANNISSGSASSRGTVITLGADTE
jgi:hypothetical protein